MTNYFREPDDLVKKAREIMTGVKIQEKKEELDPVNKQAVKKKFADRKDKDIDNDGDVDSTDKYLHKRRKAISKSLNEKDMECPSCGKMMTAGAGEKCPKCGKMINAAHCEEVEVNEKLKYEGKFKKGDTIKSFDFEKNRDHYVSGKITGIEMRRGSKMYVIKVTNDSGETSGGRVGKTNYIPMELPRDYDGRIVKEEVELDEAKGDYVITLKGKEMFRGKSEADARSAFHKLRMKHGNDVKVIKEEAKDQDSDGEKMTAAQKQDMDGDGKKERKKKKNNDKEMEGKPDKIETEPSQDDIKTMVSEREMSPGQKAKLDKMKKKYEGGEMHKAMKAKYGDKSDEVFYGKLTKMAMGEAVDMNESNELIEFFKYEDIDGIRKEIEAGVKAPFVKTQVSTLGGKERASIAIAISLDDPSTWQNKILQNSRYIKFMIHHPGNKLESISQSYKVGKFRKSNIKNTKDIITKINKWVKDNESVKEEVDMNENRTGYNKDSVDKAIKRDPRIKGKEAKAIHALLKGRSAKNRKEEVDMNENNDDEKDTNIIMQLRKVISLRGNKVKFDDGKSANVTDKDAQKFMSMFSKLKKPAEKQMLMKSASKSHMHFKNALAGKVEKPKSGGLDLPGLKSNK